MLAFPNALTQVETKKLCKLKPKSFDMNIIMWVQASLTCLVN